MTAFDLKIEHGTVLTLDGQRRVVEDGAVAIRGDRIVALDRTDALAGEPAARTLDASGRLVLPGLVSTHCHDVLWLARGLGDEGAVDVWTSGRVYPFEALLTEEDAYWSTLLGCVEMIRTGTTCHADAGGHLMDGVGRALTECGVRAVFAWAGMDEFPEGHEPPRDFPGRKTTDETLAAGAGLVKRWHKTANDRVRVSYALRLEANVSDELFQGVKAYAERDETLVQLHCLLPGLADVVKDRTGMSTVQWMAGLGALGPNWLLSHLTGASDSDIVIAKMHDAKVAHVPAAARRSGGSSRGKLAELLGRGVIVGLGADSVAAGHGVDLFRAMREVAMSDAEAEEEADPIPAEKALRMATVDGARALGWDADIGSLEVGKRADLIVVETRRGSRPPADPAAIVAGLVGAGEETHVETTIVDGQILMENRRLTTIDGPRVLAEGQRIAERIARQLP